VHLVRYEKPVPADYRSLAQTARVGWQARETDSGQASQRFPIGGRKVIAEHDWCFEGFRCCLETSRDHEPSGVIALDLFNISININATLHTGRMSDARRYSR
jgi:hypothetical protein